MNQPGPVLLLTLISVGLFLALFLKPAADPAAAVDGAPVIVTSMVTGLQPESESPDSRSNAVMRWTSPAAAWRRLATPLPEPVTPRPLIPEQKSGPGERSLLAGSTPEPTPATTLVTGAAVTPIAAFSSSVPTTTVPPDQRRLVVDQDLQIMVVFENEQIVRRMPISSGAPTATSLTPAWEGRVGEDWGSGSIGREGLYVDHMWYLFAGPEGSILIHSLPYRPEEGLKQYDQPEALGIKPTSHGCIRISPEDAAWLKVWNPVGVPIQVNRWTGPISKSQ